MKNKLRFIALSASVLLVACLGLIHAQTRPAASPTPSNSLLTALPPSDAVALVKVKRVFDEVIPKLLAANTTKLSEVNSRIEQFKTRTGLDPRSFDELALGLRYTHPSPGVTKVETVGIARGTFSAEAMKAAGKAAAGGGYREEKYQGKVIHVYSVNEQLKLFGLVDLRIRELAVSLLDANTLAVGDLARVRTTIGVRRGTNRGNAELIALASNDANAIASFGGNISPAVIQSLKIGNDAIATDLAAVRQVYGSVAMNETNLEVLLAARTVNPDSARNLSDTMESLRQFGAIFVNQMPATKGALAKSALGNLKITRQGNEIQIRTAVAQTDVAPLIGRQ
ncbi:MAG TPA: hypothetical protein VFH31_16150 [Pyrinomonadaceae bacterium]|nr:hypothetical protein [Pyrinomonadaceae bacterium]